MPEKTRKKLFYIMIALGFLAVTIYEFLTPNMSDDIIYWDKVAEEVRPRAGGKIDFAM